MKKIPAFIALLLSVSVSVFGQDNDYIQKPTFGVHFIFTDFQTAAAVRANSLGVVLKNRQFGKIKTMSPGLALNYIQGITRTFDISASLAGSFVDYPFPNKKPVGADKLLLEADFSVRAKLISNRSIINPYLQAGLGASKFQGYYGAFVPLGAGLQVNIFNEAYLLINAQYRVPVTEITEYHFFWGIGLAGNIGKKKN